MGGWVAGSNENITISTQVKVVVEVRVELGNYCSMISLGVITLTT